MARPRIPWIERESTNRDSLVFLVVGIVSPLILGALGKTEVVKTLPPAVWFGIAIAACVAAAAFRLGRRGAIGHAHREIEKYAEHVVDALDTLQQVLRGDVPPLPVRDFIKEGLFEQAQAILASDGTRGDLRFSVLEPVLPEDKEFEMKLALGHHSKSLRKFRLGINGSFAGLAYASGDHKWSNDTDTDDRFQTHPRARPGREYRSIVAVPMRKGEAITGVFVVVATAPGAFNEPEVAYIRQLAAIADVAQALPKAIRDAKEAEAGA
jgi:GAF domain-containing protein